jgi:HAE1 family hydrophobic/amphiphilic exporter-1
MISDVFIKRPVTSIVVSVMIVLIGIIAMTTLPVSQYPDITPPTVAINGTYVGADAQTVEQTTTTAIEAQVNGTPGMSFMQSNSTSSGVSSVTVTFDIGTNIDIATQVSSSHSACILQMGRTTRLSLATLQTFI